MTRTERDNGPPPLKGRLSAAGNKALDSRKSNLFLAGGRPKPATAPKPKLSAAEKRLWSLLEEKSAGESTGKRKVQPEHQNKRPRKEGSSCLLPGTIPNPIAPPQTVRFGTNDTTRPKDVLQVYSHANLLPAPGSIGISGSLERKVAQTATGSSERAAAKPVVSGRGSLAASPAAASKSRTVATATSSATRESDAHFFTKGERDCSFPTAPALVNIRKGTFHQHAAIRRTATIAAPMSREPPGRPPRADTAGEEPSSSDTGQLPARIGLVGLANRPRSTFSTRMVDSYGGASVSLQQAADAVAVDSMAPSEPLRTDVVSAPRDEGGDGSEREGSGSKASLDEGPSARPAVALTSSSSLLASTLDIPKLNRGDQGGTPSARKPNQKRIDNFVRLNLKNSSGSCRGRPSRNHRGRRPRHGSEAASGHREPAERPASSKIIQQESFLATTDLMDPVDGFLDGVYVKSADPSPRSCEGRPPSDGRRGKRSVPPTKTIPHCRIHNLPCKLCTVKTNKTSNKGRQFWVCSLPREEQCQHFQWAEDSVQAAQQALLRNQTASGFIARRVASYMQGLAPWTVTELRSWMDRHGVACPRSATKSQIKTKIAIWVRDQVARSVPEHERSQDGPGNDDPAAAPQVTLDTDENDDMDDSDPGDDSSTTTSSSDEELEVLDIPAIALQAKKCSYDEEEGKTKVVSAPRPQPRANVECPLKATLQSLFGFSSFRHGQEWAIRRCLDNERTILVAPTGFGKSLCYAIPAAMKDGVCIVVSPLLSLIQDQLRMLPPQLAAVTLSGSLSAATMASTLDDILRGRIKIVFVSPERLASPSLRRMFHRVWNADDKAYRRRFPKVSLLCVDEAHCLSQWAHNFRPAYLRLRSVVQLIQPESILAITATAGPRVVRDISRLLRPNDDENLPQDADNRVLVLKTDRDNIDVSSFVLTSQEERLKALISLLSHRSKHSMTSKCKLPHGCLSKGSVIVYVWRQRDAEVVAENIQASSVTGGVVVYHAGMKSCDREKAQSKFLRGKVRICVATVAFGLGIDKPDVRGVVHMSLASSTEHYLQEIGRAGRDGYPAKAIALILPDEVLVRHSLIHSDKISRSQTRRVFDYLRRSVDESLSLIPRDRPNLASLMIGLPVNKTVSSCDCKAETVETLISLLELSTGGEPLGYVDGVSYDCVTISPKRRHLKDLAECEPLARAAIACGVCVEAPAGEAPSTQRVPCHDGRRIGVGSSFGAYKFSVSQCANVLGPDAEPRHVFAALRRLEKSGELELALDTSPSGKSLIVRLTRTGLDEFSVVDEARAAKISDEIHHRLACTVDVAARKTLAFSRIMLDVSTVTCDDRDRGESKKSESLVRFQGLVNSYLASIDDGNVDLSSSSLTLGSSFLDVPSVHELSNIVSSVQTYLATVERGITGLDEFMIRIGDSSTSDYAALAVTKFLHGIGSCRAPYSVLRTNPMFGRLQGVRFSDLERSVEDLFERRKCQATGR